MRYSFRVTSRRRTDCSRRFFASIFSRHCTSRVSCAVRDTPCTIPVTVNVYVPGGVPTVEVVCAPLLPPAPHPAKINRSAKQRAGIIANARSRIVRTPPDALASVATITMMPIANRGNARDSRDRSRKMLRGVWRGIAPGRIALPAVVAALTVNPAGETPAIFADDDPARNACGAGSTRIEPNSVLLTHND